MKKNRGMTIVEILVSIVLISIVTLMLFRLLILLRNDDNLNVTKSKIILTQDVITNSVQQDIYSIGVNDVNLYTNACAANATNTNECCVLGEKCIKLSFKSNETREISLYIDGEIHAIKYGNLSRILPTGITFGVPSIKKSSTYIYKYRYDSITKVSIPIVGVDINYTMDFIVPTSSSDITFLRINNSLISASTTTVASITLYASTSVNASTMCFSNTPSNAGCSWIPYTEKGVAWTLTSGEGIRTVYAWFKAADGNIVDEINTSIYANVIDKSFSYTGNSQSFVANIAGYYSIEAWGASGQTNTIAPGNGGYASGVIWLKKGEVLYIYVGGSNGGFNGGGPGWNYSNLFDESSTFGGGATDIRLDSGAWDNDKSLRSRIMVAGGGGGGQRSSFAGGAGGGLSGGNTGSALGGTQISGYSFGTGQPGATDRSYSGAGGGYWGGKISTSIAYAAAGGSSFISGYTGCVAVINENSTSPRKGNNGSTCADGTTDNVCSKHYSGKVFTNTVMIAGNGSMPNPSGGTMTGNTGNGYARITYLGETEPTVNPSLTIGFSPYGNTTPLQSQSVVVTAAGAKVLKYVWSTSNTANASSGTTFTSGSTLTQSVAGDYYLCIYAEDNSGNVSNTCSNVFIIKSLNNNIVVSLEEGMIPVAFNGSLTVVANSSNESNSWYDYDNQKWANMVLVTDASRNTYKNASAGTTVSEAHILGYFVWVPRYRYKLWNASNGNSNEQEIMIEFENKEAAKSTGSTNGTWLTHPAFTFGTAELNGIWVGKFETSADKTSSCYTSPSIANCDRKSGITPRVVANVDSWKYATVSTYFDISRMFKSNTMYGISGTSVDSHMMKNMEWGAVAYLSHSKYGKYGNASYTGANKEIYINNYANGLKILTGCSAGTPSANASTACLNGTNAFPNTSISATGASTSGTIYGIYDMSGGAAEYVMGNMVNSSGAFYPSSAGTFTGGTPASKYYDSYVYGTSYQDHANGKLGDATRETVRVFRGEMDSWYLSYAYFTYSSRSWFIRGGHAGYGLRSGIFSFSSYMGSDTMDYASRVVLAS